MTTATWNKRGTLIQFANQILHNRDEAEDCADEAIGMAIEKAGTRTSENEFGWVMSILKNLCLHRIRDRKIFQRNAGAFFGDQYKDPPDAALLRKELADQVEGALERLTPMQREVVKLHLVEGLTGEEVGVRMGIAPGAVRAHACRARDALRESLKKLTA